MTPQELKNSILQLAIQGRLVDQRPEEGTAAELVEKISRGDAENAENNFTRSRGARGERGGTRGLSHLPKAALTPRGTHSATSASPREEIPDAEKPFDIPESWEWVRLGDVVSNHGQKTPSEDFSYIDIGSIDNKNQRLSEKETIVHASDASPRARKIVQKGDVLYATVRPYLHNVCIIDRVFSHEPIASTGFAVMACADCLDNRFLFHFLLSPDFDRYANSAENAKGVAYPAISDKRLYNALLPLPPLAEQNRIVAKIEELLPLIDRYEKAWSRLEDFNKRFPVDMQKSLLQMAIQGKLVEQREEEGTAAELVDKITRGDAESAENNLTRSRGDAECAEGAGKISRGAAERAENNLTRSRGARGGGARGLSHLPKAAQSPQTPHSATSASPREKIPDAEKPFDIPESWEWVRLGEIMLDVSTGPFGSMLHKADYCDGGIPLVNPMNIQEGKIVSSDKMRVSAKTAERLSAYRLSEGMVVVARRGELGRCACVGKEQDGWLCGTGSFFLDPSKELFVPFITLVISSPYARQLFAGKAVGTTMANLNHNLLKALPFPLPPLAEQKRIVAKLEELLPLCERLK